MPFVLCVQTLVPAINPTGRAPIGTAARGPKGNRLATLHRQQIENISVGKIAVIGNSTQLTVTESPTSHARTIRNYRASQEIHQ